jgi:hypothetical protein
VSQFSFVPLEGIGQFNQGKVYEDFMEKLAALQDTYIKHLRKYGLRAASQKAKLSLVVEFSTDVDTLTAMIENGEAGAVGIACQIKVAPPDPPAYTSVASVDSHPSKGRECLFVQRGGSKMDSPQQGTLLTDDGRHRVDVETGEILEEAQA